MLAFWELGPNGKTSQFVERGQIVTTQSLPALEAWEAALHHFSKIMLPLPRPRNLNQWYLYLPSTPYDEILRAD